jgi:hypothetical protein
MNEFAERMMAKHNFVVRVEGTFQELESGERYNGIKVDFIGKFTKQYLYEENDTGSVMLVFDNSEYLMVANYIARWYILLDIYRICKQLNLPLSIVRCFKDDQRVDYVEVFPLTMSEGDIVIEKELNDLIDEVLSGRAVPSDFEESIEELNLTHSFTVLKGLLV